MTVSSLASLAGPFLADGVNRSWTYNFKALAATDLFLLIDNGSGVITEVGSAGFSVTGLGNDAGGVITYPIAPTAALAAPNLVTVARRLPYTQSTKVGNQGAYYPKVHETAWDRLTMMVQQVLSLAQASLRAPEADGAVNLVIPGKAARSNKVLGFDINGLPIVAGNSSDLLTIAASVTTAEGARDAALAALDSFDDRYLMAKSAAPTLDNDGNALVVGALYWATHLTPNRFRAWDGAGWVDASTVIPAGMVIDRAYAEYTANAALATIIPSDDTIPQVTEGTQVLSVAITPKSTTNRVRVRFQAEGSCSQVAALVAALFVNGGANAVRASYTTIDTADYGRTIALEFEHVPGSLAAQTYSIRVGAGGGTARLNGTSAARVLGGTMAATLVVEEIKA